jgi:hypothetical protein
MMHSIIFGEIHMIMVWCVNLWRSTSSGKNHPHIINNIIEGQIKKTQMDIKMKMQETLRSADETTSSNISSILDTFEKLMK